ncbi:hypothetical protein LBK6_04620 [Leptospira borgpetersenii serovar Hardjo]|nr:hypothetical protein LBK6_04620 [Leptospira borgpetersenii serovar Hardjo]AWV69547.1 hypothetical protein B9T54_05020 [Leptospira borgpetersenii serovar Hardjo-bovis]TQE51320.1 hypothetical protein FFZ95_14765 [Leptospira borgpetersenii]AMX60897.1 hypothetical protein LBK9_04560 [Leptospira borgpetersenii serovar Hardjo]AMX64140.1 hypothetical protein LBK30_04595 [Leptospira borgpetersenii serovar Hardjo]
MLDFLQVVDRGALPSDHYESLAERPLGSNAALVSFTGLLDSVDSRISYSETALCSRIVGIYGRPKKLTCLASVGARRDLGWALCAFNLRNRVG